MWKAIELAFGSDSWARFLSLLSQLQSLCQGDSTTIEYLGKAKVLIEQLAEASRPLRLDKKNLYMFRGLCHEYRLMVSSLISKEYVTVDQLSNYLTANLFIYADDFAQLASPQPPAALVTYHNDRS